LAADLAKLQQLIHEYNVVRSEIVALRSRIAELRSAKSVLEEKRPRTVFRIIGPVMVETGLEEALSFIEDELEVSELRLRRLEEQEKKLAKTIEELERRLGIAPS